MLPDKLGNILLQFFNNWFLIRKSMYFILIKDIYFCPKTNKIMVKYQCSNKRIGDIIFLEDFMKSPLKHATHPDQIFQIGVQTERLLETSNSKKKSQSDNKEILLRFKKIFYNNETT